MKGRARNYLQESHSASLVKRSREFEFLKLQQNLKGIFTSHARQGPLSWPIAPASLDPLGTFVPQAPDQKQIRRDREYSYGVWGGQYLR